MGALDCHALQRKSHLCVPRKGISQPQSQFPHSCVYKRFIYSQDGSFCNIIGRPIVGNVKIGTMVAQFLFWEYLFQIFGAVWLILSDVSSVGTGWVNRSSKLSSPCPDMACCLKLLFFTEQIKPPTPPHLAGQDTDQIRSSSLFPLWGFSPTLITHFRETLLKDDLMLGYSFSSSVLCKIFGVL